MQSITVSVPASSANLGPGYDCLAVALPMRNVVEVERRPGPLEVTVAGEGAETLPSDASNLVVRSFAEVWDGPLEGLAFHMRNEVPLESGTGSSSAAIVAGLAASLALQGRPHGSAELIALAAPIEGHPDNVAAAIAGGFTLALDGEAPLLRRIEPPAGLAFVLVVPDHALGTTESRKSLRAEVPRADAVYSLQRTALLVHALATGVLDALPRALEDRLHQPDRSQLTPLFCRLQDALPGLGAYGCTLSGAGPSTLLWVRADEAAAIAARVAAIEPDAQVSAIAPEPRGVLVSSEGA
ncbi:MAG: homoserine kinase [Gaiellales bacterium]|nr:homoserine kinase [Gaiellales bacterium]MDX6596326.1 homoserine kinase [Gaiellales bacterium]